MLELLEGGGPIAKDSNRFNRLVYWKQRGGTTLETGERGAGEFVNMTKSNSPLDVYGICTQCVEPPGGLTLLSHVT
ncbi:UNVERIFIED_CONTAM: hypothetical protein FKN15_034905 [Acipenser sinensis]